MSSDTKAIISTIVGTGVVLGGLLLNQNAGLNIRIDDLRTDLTNRIDNLSSDVDDLKTDMRDMNARLRNVEIAFGKVDQRLLTLERAIIPAAAAPQ